jgi:hypothetical protein
MFEVSSRVTGNVTASPSDGSPDSDIDCIFRCVTQRPYFPYWLAGPAVVYAVDKMISLSRRRIFLPVIGAELLPSGTGVLPIDPLVVACGSSALNRAPAGPNGGSTNGRTCRYLERLTSFCRPLKESFCLAIRRRRYAFLLPSKLLVF